MNNRQENRLQMYYATRDVCRKQESLINEISLFSTAYNQFLVKINAIEDASRLQINPTTGLAVKKTQAKTDMVNSAIRIRNAMLLLATDLNDVVLKGKLTVSRSRLLRNRSTMAFQMCRIILDLVQGHAVQIGNYMISPEDIETFRTQITDYENLMNAPRGALITRKNITQQIQTLFKETDLILKEKLDHMVDMLRDSHPDFYYEYFSARMIIDVGHRYERKNEDTVPVAVS